MKRIRVIWNVPANTEEKSPSGKLPRQKEFSPGSLIKIFAKWIDFFNGTTSPHADALVGFIEADVGVWIMPTILQELLQGFQNDSDFEIVRDLLLAYPIIEADPVEAAIGAATLYRTARKYGITIRKSNDCLIAWYALQAGLPILHKDRDFEALSSITKLELARIC
jgi:predicted nucleic acid-binding protein